MGPQITKDISRLLTGSFGNSRQYNFQTNAHVTNSENARYSVRVDGRVGSSRTDIGGPTGSWHLGQLFPGVDAAYIAAHETLHFLGLDDLYKKDMWGRFIPDHEKKPMPRDGYSADNFMVARGGTLLYDWQIQIIINSNGKTQKEREWKALAWAMKHDSGALGPGNAGVYYNGTIYASGLQAMSVMAWDRTYGTLGFFVPGGNHYPKESLKKK